jgi:formylglycine-generating enzyme required for sulfatase activity
MTDQVRVFVSHSHQDNEYCREYVAGLRAHECTVWYDEHNLGWGELRATIQSELERSQHFVAILSPASVASQWVNREIDASIQLADRGQLKSIIFVVAKRCTVPLLLSSWKRIESPGGAPIRVGDAVAKTLNIIGVPSFPPYSPSSPPVVAPKAQPAPPSEKPKPILGPVHPAASQGVSRRVLIGSGAVAGLAIVGGGVWLATHTSMLLANAGSSPTHTPSVPVALSARLTSLGFSVENAKNSVYILPPVSPVTVGEFLMGSDPKKDANSSEDETPQQRLTLGAFEVGTYQVTVAEYNAFVRSGHAPPQYWNNQLTKLEIPVVYVTWSDAVAYATWLANLTGQPWRLPSEAEWEKAARGTDGRIYPWGDTFDASRSNTYIGSKGPKATTPVGLYPNGASPYGVRDMLGNVREWTNSIYDLYPYRTTDGREDSSTPPPTTRVVRGASWSTDIDTWVRVAKRYPSQSDYAFNDVGFRLVRAAPQLVG